MYNLIYILLTVCLIVSSGCTAAMRPFHTQQVVPGLQSKANESLQALPAPKEKIIAAVYRFSDQTGQYKPSDQIASWSTAVTQGATAILIKAMEESGWFVPIEREGLANLLNERKIINSTRSQNGDNTMLAPLLFAGIILEGGIIGYDTNIITGGAGVRYFGTGVSGQFRKDQVTIYLRAVSTQTGRILNTVHTTKSIISQKLDGGVFRFVDTSRLLEAEAGYTFNEPPVMAVTEAIDEALRKLIIEGVEDGLWSPDSEAAFASYKKAYTAHKMNDQHRERDYFGLNRDSGLRKGVLTSANVVYGSHIGSYGTAREYPGLSGHLELFFAPAFSLKFNVMRSEIGARRVFSEPFSSGDVLLNFYVTPYFKLSPYIGLGVGVIAYDKRHEFVDEQFFPTATAEAGLDYRFNRWFGFRIGVDYRYLVQDGIDGVRLGSIHDQQWNIVTGLTITPRF